MSKPVENVEPGEGGDGGLRERIAIAPSTNLPPSLSSDSPDRVSDERLAKIIKSWEMGNRDVYETACDLRDCRAKLAAARVGEGEAMLVVESLEHRFATLQTRADALAAALRKYVDRFADDGFHKRGCPEDDTCDCSFRAKINALLASHAPDTKEPAPRRDTP